MLATRDVEETSHLPDYCKAISFRDANGVVKQLVFPKALDLDRPKRARTTFSSNQLDRLEDAFQASQYLVGKDRLLLAGQLGLSETQVKVWFQNRRTKHKKDEERKHRTTNATAESLATKSVLKMLEFQSTTPITTPVVPRLYLKPATYPDSVPVAKIPQWTPMLNPPLTGRHNTPTIHYGHRPTANHFPCPPPHPPPHSPVFSPHGGPTRQPPPYARCPNTPAGYDLQGRQHRSYSPASSLHQRPQHTDTTTGSGGPNPPHFSLTIDGKNCCLSSWPFDYFSNK